MNAFTPSGSVTLTLTAAQGTTAVSGVGHILRIANAGAGNAYVAFYESGTTQPTLGLTTSMLLPSGVVEMFSVGSSTVQVAYMGDATGTTLNITRGSGA